MPYNNPAYLTGSSDTQSIKEGSDRANENFAELALPNKAALRDVQTNRADRTAGALMAVGAGGLLGSLSIESDIDDLNAFPETKFFRTDQNTLNLPNELHSAASPGIFLSGQGDSINSRRFMFVANTNSDAFGVRRKAFGDVPWSPWRYLYHTGNILGTVSQSGGVPTGAIIEAGSNSNGRYTKFADGTLIQTSVIEKSGNDTNQTNFSSNFPVAFTASPSFSFTWGIGGNSTTRVSTWRLPKSSLSAWGTLFIQLTDSALSTDTEELTWTAIGRWW